MDDASVVAAYEARPPYPESLVALILDIAGAVRPRLLDLGCGTAELTRRLAPHAGAIVAVDRSPRMIAAARALPGGDAANIAWIVAEMETAPLVGPFDLVTPFARPDLGLQIETRVTRGTVAMAR